MEWQQGSITYILPLDSIDINLLSIRQHGNDATVPIWSASKPNEEYYEFELYAEAIEDSDCVENFKTQPCHICNVAVPTAYLKEHYNGKIHKIMLKLTENAIERCRKQMSNEILITDTKCDINFFCEVCVEVIQLKNKNSHERSQKHLTSVKYDEFIQEYATAFMSRDDFFNNNGIINKENMKVSEENNDRNSQKEDGDGGTSMTSKTVNDEDQNNYKENANIETEKIFETISSTANVVLKHFGENPGVTITLNEGCKVSVSMDNFRGLYRVAGHVQCRLCRVLVLDEEQHVTGGIHMQYVQRDIPDQHCIRQLDTIWSHCIICNDFVENKQVHISGAEHMSLLNKATTATNVPPTATAVTAGVMTITSVARCIECDVLVSNDTASLKRHRKSKQHRHNEFIYKHENILHSHMMQKNQHLVDCKICKISLPRIEEDIDTHTFSAEHIFQYDKKLEDNFITKTDEYVFYCGACNKSVRNYKLFTHLVQKGHKRKLSKKVGVLEALGQNNLPIQGHSNLIQTQEHKTEVFEDEDESFSHEFTTHTFTNSNIVEMSSHKQNIDLNYAMKKTPSAFTSEGYEKENHANNIEQHTKNALATYVFMQESVVMSSGPSTSSSLFVAPNHQNASSSSSNSAITQQKTQGQNKPIMTKNYIHWLNINKFTPVTEYNDQYKCGFCDLVVSKAALFDHSNNVVHKSNVEKMVSPNAEEKTDEHKDGAEKIEKKTDSESSDIEEEVSQAELKVGASKIDLPKSGFYHCKVCKTWMPSTEACMNLHDISKKHLSKLDKLNKFTERRRKREEHLNPTLEENTESLTTKATAKNTTETSPHRLCKYCKAIIYAGTELDHVNSETHKKNVAETLKDGAILLTAAADDKNDEDSYNSKIIEDAFGVCDKIDKPSNSTRPENAPIANKNTTIKKVGAGNISDKIFCTICNDSIPSLEIRHHLKAFHASITDLEQYDFKEIKCNTHLCGHCNVSFYGRWNALFHMLEDHLNILIKYNHKTSEKARNENDPFNSDTEKDEEKILQPNNEEEINICITSTTDDDWYNINDDNIVFEAKTTKSANTSHNYVLRQNDGFWYDDSTDSSTVNIKQDFEKTGNATQLFCKICKVRTPISDADIKIHVEGSKHRKLLALSELSNDASKTLKEFADSHFDQHFEKTGNPKQLFCKICKVMTASEPDIKTHVEGKKHMKLLAKLFKEESETRNTNESVATNFDTPSTSNPDMSIDATNHRSANISHNYVLRQNDGFWYDDLADGFWYEDITDTSTVNIKQDFQETSSAKELFCNICQVIILNSDVDIKIHEEGLIHRTLLSLSEESKTLKEFADSRFDQHFEKTGNPKQLFCKICKVMTASEPDIKTHVDGKKHMKLLAKLFKEETVTLNTSESITTNFDTPSSSNPDMSTENKSIGDTTNHRTSISDKFYFVAKAGKVLQCRLCNIIFRNNKVNKRDHSESRLHNDNIQFKLRKNTIYRHHDGFMCNACAKPLRTEEIVPHMESYTHIALLCVKLS